METIGANQYYSVEIDQGLNRLYLTGKGFWKDVNIAQNFLAHVKQGVQRLLPGYSVLADLHEFKTPPPEVAEFIIESQRITSETIGKSAQVVGKNAAIEMPMNRYASTSGIKPRNRSFATRAEAEAYLDAA
ncbi:hypothetical protein U14_01773 [Candidatus Moduliflexus flocculans]|uniref:Uncharacterized protein n=1 Tax=Candidatus Moduliflexus flocculans TaxID=1499966 RepID=A0A0S6VZD8_9BACT|nr:hypothetical protein U14_01773 [Candidatus Moduliflexus flocculans]